jgi:hypothetical protein
MEKNTTKRGASSEAMVTPAQPTNQATATRADSASEPKRRVKQKPTTVQVGWTEQRRKAVTQHLQTLLPLMKLQDWTVKVMWDKLSDEFDDAYATNQPLGDSRHCEVRFSRKFLELDDYEMTQVIVHELLHCHMFAVEDFANDVVGQLTTKKTSAVFNTGFTKLIETSIDGIADSITQMVPMFTLPQR